MNMRISSGLLLLVLCFLLSALPAQSATFCVNDAAGLQAALGEAESNGENDTIRVVQGTYHGNFLFISAAGEAWSVTLLGGYEPGCGSRVIDPSKTILDGDESASALGLRNLSGGNVAVEGFTFRRGKSATYGGGLRVRADNPSGPAGAVTVKNCAFTDNVAEIHGGGAWVECRSYSGTGGDIMVMNNTVSGNTATDRSGGGMWVGSYAANGARSGKITIDRNSISANRANETGGGIRVNRLGNSGDLVFTDNKVYGNISRGAGGGVKVYTEVYDFGQAAHMLLRGNFITGNTSEESHGGGIDLYLASSSGAIGDIKLVNNIIAGNTASKSSGGGVYLNLGSDAGVTGDITLTNNTITGNTGFYSPGGAYLASKNNARNVFNNIIWGNISPQPADLYLSSDPKVTNHGFSNDYSSFSGTWTSSGGNLIDADPLFIDPSSGNYRIQRESPCRNAGLATAPEVPARDFEGQLRKQVDIGADEYPEAQGVNAVIPLLLLE